MHAPSGHWNSTFQTLNFLPCLALLSSNCFVNCISRILSFWILTFFFYKHITIFWFFVLFCFWRQELKLLLRLASQTHSNPLAFASWVHGLQVYATSLVYLCCLSFLLSPVCPSVYLHPSIRLFIYVHAHATTFMWTTLRSQFSLSAMWVLSSDSVTNHLPPSLLCTLTLELTYLWSLFRDHCCLVTVI